METSCITITLAVKRQRPQQIDDRRIPKSNGTPTENFQHSLPCPTTSSALHPSASGAVLRQRIKAAFGALWTLDQFVCGISFTRDVVTLQIICLRQDDFYNYRVKFRTLNSAWRCPWVVLVQGGRFTVFSMIFSWPINRRLTKNEMTNFTWKVLLRF